jgi:hypothetical protein
VEPEYPADCFRFQPQLNGLQVYLAEEGKRALVLLYHGFPEL